MTFWCGPGSGSADPCLWLMDPDSDPEPEPGSESFYFCHWTSRCQQKKVIFFLLITIWRYIYDLHNFTQIKSQKESQNKRNQGFSNYFWMMIEGFGSIPLTNGSGSGSGRPKNMWIRNTAWTTVSLPILYIPFKENLTRSKTGVQYSGIRHLIQL